MGKKNTIAQLLTNDKERKSKAQQIQTLYQCYLDGVNKEKTFEDLIKHLEEFSYGRVKEILKKSPHYSLQDVEDIIQETSLSILDLLEKHRTNHENMDAFPWYARRIYENKATDFVRESYRKKGDLPTRTLGILTEEGKEIDIIGKNNIEEAEEESYERAKLSVIRKLRCLYCDTMMNHDTEPQKLLALCYGRLIFLLDHMYRCGTVSKTLSSPKWAQAQMEGQTLISLSEKSQGVIRKYIHRELAWGQPFREYMPQTSPYHPFLPWEALVYTDHFTLAQTSNWIESIQKSIVKDAKKKIRSDAELLAEVLSCEESFYGELGGKTR